MKTGAINAMQLGTIVVIMALLLTSCDNVVGIRGEGPIVTQELNIDDFRGIELDGSYDVVVRQGNEQFVEAEGHANIIERIRTEVSGGVWLIDLLRGSYRDLRLTIYITTPGLESLRNSASGDILLESMESETLSLELDGSGDIDVSEFLQIEQALDIESDGSGNIEVEEISAAELDIKMDASGNVDLGGTAGLVDIDISGSGDLRAFAVDMQEVSIQSSASGEAEITVEKSLRARLSGSGDVNFRGNPEIDVRETGSGRLRDRN